MTKRIRSEKSDVITKVVETKPDLQELPLVDKDEEINNIKGILHEKNSCY